MKDVIIFGAGHWGDAAYEYYKHSSKVVAYVDNNKNLWYSEKNGIIIFPPSILKERKAIIVIANAKYEQEIKDQLREQFGIPFAVVFKIVIETEELNGIPDTEDEELIVSFKGGLGNQMFQYAFYRMLEQKGKCVKADLLHYLLPGSRDFELKKVFPRVKLQRASGKKVCRYKKLTPYTEEKIGQVYLEPDIMNGVETFADKRLMRNDLKNGYFMGYFQSRVFPEAVEKELREEYVFESILDKKLAGLVKWFREKEIVGVHVRRGDYLKCPPIYGNICTIGYYRNAIQIIQKKVSNAIFCFFSDDIEWVKKNLKKEDAIYVEKTEFKEYHNWYDMYLMSLCKHNIIANSSFSWWGAWLNNNENKIVVAPKRWVNADAVKDICPEGWIRI